MKRISLITVFVSGTAAAVWYGYQTVNHYRNHDPKYTINGIIQTSSTSHYVETQTLAEWLDLSADRPKNLYQYDIQKATKTLKSFSFFSKVAVKKYPPSILYVDYTLRQPIAKVADFENTAIDSEGVLFPLHPFYGSLKLPSVYLGLTNTEKVWGSQIQGDTFTLAYELISRIQSHLTTDFLKLELVDTSVAYSDQVANKEIVLTFSVFKESQWKPLYVRMHLNDYDGAYGQLITLLKKKDLFDKPVKTIDLRLKNSAIISLYS